MKALVVEDDSASRMLMQELLKPYGEIHIAANGAEALFAYKTSLDTKAPYDLVCLDIMMPGIDGKQVLRKIRETEDKLNIFPGDGVKIFMTSALGDKENVFDAYRDQCDAYLVKPISKQKLLEHLKAFGLIKG